MYNYNKRTEDVKVNKNTKSIGSIVNINNIDNSTNTTNIQINNHYHINPLGQEDISFITSNDKLKLLSSKYDGVIELTKLIHSKPENMNFYKPNKKDNVLAYINREGKLQHGNYEIICNDIINNNMTRFDDIYNDVGDKLNKKVKNQVDKVIKDNNKLDTLDRYKNQFDLYVLDSNKKHKRKIQNVYSIKNESGEVGTVIMLKD